MSNIALYIKRKNDDINRFLNISEVKKKKEQKFKKEKVFKEGKYKIKENFWYKRTIFYVLERCCVKKSDK